MVIALAVVVILFLAALVVGGITGRVRLTGCCAVADPRRDARMRAAFLPSVPTPPASSGGGPVDHTRQDGVPDLRGE